MTTMHTEMSPRLSWTRRRLDWLPQRSCTPRRKLQVKAVAGPVPPPAKELPADIVTRQYRRTVYDFALWAKHRDVNRYLYNLKTIPGSRIIRTLSQPMGIVLAWSALFGFYETCLDSGVLPSYLPKLTLMSAEPQGLTSFALSLLLVFRTNSSYGRFDEARKIWGGILNRARNIANQAVTFIPADDAVGREAVAKWTVGFCRALQAHLQEDADLRAELGRAQPRWAAEEIDMLCSAQHRPIKAISMLSELTRQLPISQFQALQMQENVTFFYDALGGCERLLRTPIPVSYTRHTARFLTIWLALLPLGLWERYHWSMLPVIALIGFLLLGIDEIGITIEEPFGILPLDAICTRAQTDVVSLLKDDSNVAQYIADVRQGRIRAPADAPAQPKPAAAAAATTAAPAPPAPVPRSASPSAASGQPAGPTLLRTVSTLLQNVSAGVGAVAPGRPPSPPRTPSPPRARSPVRAGSPGGPNPFPRASAGTGTGNGNGNGRSAAPPPASFSDFRSSAPGGNGAASAAFAGVGAGFGAAIGGPRTGAPPKPAMDAPSKLDWTGLSDRIGLGSMSAQERVASSAFSAAKQTPAAPAPAGAQEPRRVPPPPPAAASPRPSAPPPAPAPAATDFASAGAGLGSSSQEGSRSGSRVGANWRAELAALREGREEGQSAALRASERAPGPQPGSSAAGLGLGSGGGGGVDAEEEAMRRFGSLAGRARSGAGGNGNGNGNGSGNGNGNGSGRAVGSSGAGGVYVSAGGSGESSRARPRTRPDWRDQL